MHKKPSPGSEARKGSAMSDQPLEELVKEYLSELANPSPDAIMRNEYRRRMAEKVGVEPPDKQLRRWHGKDTDDE